MSASKGPAIYQPVVMLKDWMITIDPTSRVDAFTKIEGGEGVTIGRFVHIASFSHLNIGGGRLIIGDYCTVSSGGRLISGSNTKDGISCSASAPKSMQVVIKKTTEMKPFSCVFAGGTVLPGVTLGEGAILGAMSLATHDIPPWEVWAGVPARCVWRRSRDKFQEVFDAIQEDHQGQGQGEIPDTVWAYLHQETGCGVLRDERVQAQGAQKALEAEVDAYVKGVRSA